MFSLSNYLTLPLHFFIRVMGKNVAQELKENNGLLQAVFDSAPNSIAVMQNIYDAKNGVEDFEILLLNSTTLKWTGNIEYKGRRYSDVFPMVKETVILEKLKQVAETGIAANFESWYASEGMSHWFRIMAVRQGELLIVTTEDITAVKKGEESLRKSEEFNRTVLESSPDCVKVLDTEGHLTYMNYNGTCILEIDDFNTVKNKAWWDLWPDGSKEQVKAAIAKALTGQTAQFQAFCPTAKGNPKWWDVMVSPIVSADGSISQLISVSRDITEKRKTEESLKDRESQLYFAIDATELGVWDYNPITNKFNSNSRMRGWFGLSQDEEFDLSLGIAVMEEADRQRVAEAIQKASKWGGGDYDIEYTIVHPQTGQRRIVRAKGKATFGNDKIAYRFNGTLQDVTEQALASKQIKESEQRFQNLVREAMVGIIVLRGAEMKVEIVNEAYAKLIHRKAAELLNNELFKIIPETEEYFRPIIDGVRDSGEELYLYGTPYFVWVDDQKKEGFLNLVYQPYREADGTISGVMVLCQDVTAQMQAQQKLEESESRFRNLVRDASAAIIVLTGPQMVTEVVNEAFGKLIGRTPEELLQKPLFDIIPETEAYYRPICEKVRQTGEPVYLYESPYTVVAEGKQIDGYLHLTYQAYRDPDGTILGVMILCQDVTESVKARRALERSEQDLRDLVLQSPTGICVIDAATLISEIVNDSFVEIAGKPYEAIMGKRYWDTFAETAPYYKAALQEVIEKGKAFYANEVAVMLIRHGREEMVYVTFVFEPMKGPDDVVKKVVVWVIDNTPQVKARQKVEESESRFRLLSNEMPQFVWTGDANGRLGYFNEAVYAYSGLSKEDVDREGWIQIVHPDERDENIRLWQQSIASGEDFIFEHRFKKWDGEYRWQLSRAVPQRDAQGAIQQWIGTSTDIQDQKDVEEQLEQLVKERTKELQRSNEDLQQFAHVASHDLKEPVRKVKTFAGRLEHHLDGKLDETGSRYIERIHSATNRMFTMIDGVLTYSTVNASTQGPQAVDLNEVMENIETDLEVTVQKTGARFTYTGLPEIEGAPVLFYQLFYNLVNNSIKFAKAGVPPVISVQSQTVFEGEKEMARIVFKDNGIGFDQEESQKIFETFTRLHSKDKYEGTGLGLALCKKIAERHGGSIEAKSSLGEGAAFVITLPVKQTKSSI